jgi:hypothetical protein
MCCGITSFSLLAPSSCTSVCNPRLRHNGGGGVRRRRRRMRRKTKYRRNCVAFGKKKIKVKCSLCLIN